MIGGIFETIGKTLGIGKEKYFLELDETAEEAAGKVQKKAASATKTAAKTAKDVSGNVKDVSGNIDVSGSIKDAAGSIKDAAGGIKGAAGSIKDISGNVIDTVLPGGGESEDAASKANDKAADKAAEQAKQKASKAIKQGDAKVKVAANEETGKIEADAVETDKGKNPAGKSAKKVVANKKKAAEAKSKKQATAPEPSGPRDPEDIIREAIAATEGAPGSQPVNPVDVDTFSTDYLMPLEKSRRRPGPSFSKFKAMARETNPKLKR